MTEILNGLCVAIELGLKFAKEIYETVKNHQSFENDFFKYKYIYKTTRGFDYSFGIIEFYLYF